MRQCGQVGLGPQSTGGEEVEGSTDQARRLSFAANCRYCPDMSSEETCLKIGVITVSDTRTLETDKSGALLVEYVEGSAHELRVRHIIADELNVIRATVESCLPECDVVLLTGGTGITARDVTPEAISPLITKPIDGFGELFRWLSYEEIGAATIQSRALAGVCGTTLVFALPGSTGAVRLALDKIIAPQLSSATRPCNFVQLMPRLR